MLSVALICVTLNPLWEAMTPNNVRLWNTVMSQSQTPNTIVMLNATIFFKDDDFVLLLTADHQKEELSVWNNSKNQEAC